MHFVCTYLVIVSTAGNVLTNFFRQSLQNNDLRYSFPKECYESAKYDFYV